MVILMKSAQVPQKVTANDYFAFRSKFGNGVRFQGIDRKTMKLLNLHTVVRQEEAETTKALMDAFNRGGPSEFFSLKRELDEKLMAEKNMDVRAIGKFVLGNAETNVVCATPHFGKELLYGAARLGINRMKE